MRIDAHQHYWKIQRDDYGWITPEIPVLYKDFLPHDLLPHLKEHRLDRTILVQAAATLDETEYLLSLSETSDTIGGVVGWLDLNHADYRKHYERFSAHPKFLGFRVMIQEMQDPNNILASYFVEALTYFAKNDVPVDLLVLSHQLPALVKLLERVPGLRGVIDHIAKPRIAEGEFEPWAGYMKEIAGHPGIYCKLSGMVTEANHQAWKPEDFTLYIHHVIHIFGTQRIMFGSDWPVCLLSASYDEVVDVLQNALPETMTEVDEERIFGLNAKQFYKL
jgi:L-fuconolactonase